MGYQLGLPAALAARGVAVETVPGWQTRGAAAFAPRGVVCHWTAGPATGDRPSLAVVVSGRADLPGPLAQVFLTRAGVAIVVAAGRANHAGSGGWAGLSGNSAVFGIEAESTGRGDWTAAQCAAYPRVVAALLDLTGTGPESVCGHNEWAPTRKIDIRDWDPAAMRAQVAALRSPATITPPTNIIKEALMGTDKIINVTDGDGTEYHLSPALGTLTPFKTQVERDTVRAGFETTDLTLNSAQYNALSAFITRLAAR